LAGALGFRANPAKTWKITAVLLPLLYIYPFVKGAPLDSLLVIFALAGLCSLAVAVIAVIGWITNRKTPWGFVRGLLTACAVFSIAPITPQLSQSFYSAGTFFTLIVSVMILAGPPGFLAAAAWTGLPGLEADARERSGKENATGI